MPFRKLFYQNDPRTIQSKFREKNLNQKNCFLFPERILILNVLCLTLHDRLGEVSTCLSLKLPTEFWRLCKRAEHFAGLTQHNGGEIMSLVMNVFQYILRSWVGAKRKWSGLMVTMHFTIWIMFQIRLSTCFLLFPPSETWWEHGRTGNVQ